MLVTVTETGKNLRASVAGRIDTSTAADFRQEISKAESPETEKLELDFSDVLYISSAGLREMLILKKRYQNGFEIKNVSSIVEEIFKTTGFSEILDYTVKEETRDYSHLSFKELLRTKVEEDSERTVVISHKRKYTWNNIECCSQIIADDLKKIGVTKGSHVALIGANSVNWIFTFYAIQKLGAIAQLVNFNLQKTEIENLKKTADIEYICFGQIAADIEEIKKIEGIKGFYNIVNEIDFTQRSAEYPKLMDKYGEKVESDDSCVMVFTSGSTGTPKGALLSAYNILNATESNIKSVELTEKDRIYLILPMFHIFGLITGLCSGPMIGAELFLAESIHTQDTLSAISEYKITVMNSVPTTMLLLVGRPEFKSELVASLRSCILSGSATTASQMAMLQEKFPNTHFAASYGMSEMAPISITDYNDSAEHITQTVGKPIGNIEVKIFNMETGKECPAGETGEIRVQGYNLMTCYYKIDLEKQAIDDEGWLHTGDLGCFDKEGYIHFAGRAKELIIRGGENIVPNEVASEISSLDGVKDVKVVGIPDDFFGEVVGAAVVMNSGELDPLVMKNALKTRLAKFKIPAFFIQYDSFPLLSNGKVDMVSLKKDMTVRCKEK